MRQPLRKFRKLTEGERAGALTFALVGACSAGLGYCTVLHLDQNAFLDEMSWYQTWVVVASGLGGLIALFLSGDRMGQSGTTGALRGLAGAIWVTFIGFINWWDVVFAVLWHDVRTIYCHGHSTGGSAVGHFVGLQSVWRACVDGHLSTRAGLYLHALKDDHSRSP